MSYDSSSVKVLLRLLRLALGIGDKPSLPDDVNWEEVYDLSLKQGVGAIACDGMLELEDCNINEELKYKWMGQSMVVEQKSQTQWKLLCLLSGLYSQHGIKTRVLKGFSFASYYPNPFHRPSTDLDICLLGDYEKGNQLVEGGGVKVDRHDSKHSHFTIHGVHVENHQFCVGLRGYKNIRDTERYLRNILDKREALLGGSQAYKPQWLFNAIFLMCHARTHFLIEEGITLKQVCDWIVLRRDQDSACCMDTFWSDCDRLGLMQFAKALDGVATYVEHGKALTSEERLMVEDILSVKKHEESDNKNQAHLRMIHGMWKNRWKFRAYSDITALRMIVGYVFGYLFDRKPHV